MSADTWSILSFVGALVVAFVLIIFAGAVVTLLLRGKIDLHNLLAEEDGKASLSRFQFLLFTFVIAGLYFLLSIEAGTLIEVPNSVLGILGISASGYVLAKGVSAGKEAFTGGSGRKQSKPKPEEKTKPVDNSEKTSSNTTPEQLIS